jgi:hypothetical protein
MLPHAKNEQHVMSIHTMKAAVLVSYGMDFCVTCCERRQSARYQDLQRRSRACPSRSARDFGSNGQRRTGGAAR